MTGCPSGSLNDVNLQDLLKRSRINDECLNEARSVFRDQYKRVNFVIHGPIINNKHGIYFDSDYRAAYFQNMDNFEYLVNNFGDMVPWIEISIESIHITNAKKVINFLNTKCTTRSKS